MIAIPGIYISRYTYKWGMIIIEIFNNNLYVYMDIEDAEIISLFKQVQYFKDLKQISSILDLKIFEKEYEEEILNTRINKIIIEVSNCTIKEIDPDNPEETCTIIENSQISVNVEEYQEDKKYFNDTLNNILNTYVSKDYLKNQLDSYFLNFQDTYDSKLEEKINEILDFELPSSLNDLEDKLNNSIDEKIKSLQNDLQSDFIELIKNNIKDYLAGESANIIFKNIDPIKFLQILDFSEIKTFIEQLSLSFLGRFYIEVIPESDLHIINHKLNSTYLLINIYENIGITTDIWKHINVDFELIDSNHIKLYNVKNKKLKVLIQRFKQDTVGTDKLLETISLSNKEISGLSTEERWSFLFNIK